MGLFVKRIYDPREASDGYRVLVDQLWPRGVAREKAGIDEWLKDIAPSTQTRRRFSHDPAKWTDFLRNYSNELAARPKAVDRLIEKARKSPVTLVYAARDTRHNNAMALKWYLEMRYPDITAAGRT
jgi:uncharacterized protein YeaO (DUF488 family)